MPDTARTASTPASLTLPILDDILSAPFRESHHLEAFPLFPLLSIVQVLNQLFTWIGRASSLTEKLRAWIHLFICPRDCSPQLIPRRAALRLHCWQHCRHPRPHHSSAHIYPVAPAGPKPSQPRRPHGSLHGPPHRRSRPRTLTPNTTAPLTPNEPADSAVSTGQAAPWPPLTLSPRLNPPTLTWGWL